MIQVFLIARIGRSKNWRSLVDFVLRAYRGKKITAYDAKLVSSL